MCAVVCAHILAEIHRCMLICHNQPVRKHLSKSLVKVFKSVPTMHHAKRSHTAQKSSSEMFHTRIAVCKAQSHSTKCSNIWHPCNVQSHKLRAKQVHPPHAVLCSAVLSAETFSRTQTLPHMQNIRVLTGRSPPLPE